MKKSKLALVFLAFVVAIFPVLNVPLLPSKASVLSDRYLTFPLALLFIMLTLYFMNIIRCQPWRAKRRLVDPSSREAALFSRRALRQRENKVGLRTRRPVIWEPSTEQQRACEVVA